MGQLASAPEYVKLSRWRMTNEGGPAGLLTGGSSMRRVMCFACTVTVRHQINGILKRVSKLPGN